MSSFERWANRSVLKNLTDTKLLICWIGLKTFPLDTSLQLSLKSSFETPESLVCLLSCASLSELTNEAKSSKSGPMAGVVLALRRTSLLMGSIEQMKHRRLYPFERSSSPPLSRISLASISTSSAASLRRALFEAAPFLATRGPTRLFRFSFDLACLLNLTNLLRAVADKQWDFHEEQSPTNQFSFSTWTRH